MTRPWNSSISTPLFWAALPPNRADAEWRSLRRWVEEFAARFSIDSRTIPPCWYRHNAMVEALSALRDHETASYEHAAGKDAGVAFIRATTDIAHFLRDHAARTGCNASGHRPDMTSRTATDEEDWQSFVDDDINTRSSIDVE